MRRSPGVPPTSEAGGRADEIRGKADIASQRSVRPPCRPTACDENGAVLRARPCKMAVAAGCSARAGRRKSQPRPARLGAAGSLVLRRMDRRAAHGRGLVRAKKHDTKRGSGAPLRRSFSSPTPYANLASARERAHNASAVRTAKKVQGEQHTWEADHPIPC